ncbi:MarR family winged helix-turn-helix transcriptional regulator [Paenibacillus sp. GCM10027627]|uniref:MarR family winged helix-turn-helix transcriptional regulator n=1 Tax=unclassified Paenibacillus TaxID=185978 RepID=UPI00362552E5
MSLSHSFASERIEVTSINGENTIFSKFVFFLTGFHQTVQDMTKDVRPESITPAQYSILEYLMVSQPATLSAISECAHMSMPNTSREIRKLSEKGLCCKEDSTDDRRKQLIRLTASGQMLMEEAFRRVEERFMERLRDASPEELAELEHALETIKKRVF